MAEKDQRVPRALRNGIKKDKTMKKEYILLSFAVGLVLTGLSACKKTEAEDILHGEFSGKWAEVDENGVCTRYLDFFMGKCYDYSCAKAHYVSDGIMYGCHGMKRRLNRECTFSNPDEGHIRIGDDPAESFQRPDAKSIRIGERRYEFFSIFSNARHPDFEVTGIVMDSPALALNIGNEADITYRLVPEKALPDTLVWSSDRNDIISVDQKV